MKQLHRSLAVAGSVLTAVCGYVIFPASYLRFWEAVRDLWNSVQYYFCWLFGLPIRVFPTVTEYSAVMTGKGSLPEEFTAFREWVGAFLTLAVSPDNWNDYWLWVGTGTKLLAKIIVLIMPLGIGLAAGISYLYGRGNTNHNQDTLLLKAFKSLSRVIYQPIRRFIRSFRQYLRERPWLVKLWITAWVFHLNLASIVAAFLAYYLYFAVTCSISATYMQFRKLLMDLNPLMTFVPVWTWLLLLYPVFHAWRKSVAKMILQHFEARNCGFIKELPIVTLSCGSMGKKKTTLITDMALSQEVMFRQKAFDILKDCDMRFPNFPWICFEGELRRCMEHGTVYNLATTGAWVAQKKKRFQKHGDASLQLYGYDLEKYGTQFCDCLRVYHLFDVLETYARAYFVYIVESSLIVSNFAIRTDMQLLDEGNFPMWYTDFFPETLAEGRFSKILDFDALRLGRHLLESNPNIGSFEFGVVAISEIGKERGNNLELREIRRNTAETNQKNDLFNAWLKMCRHSATIDHFPFIKVFADEQRPESWGADARDLCDILRILSSGEESMALPFYTLEEMLSEWVANRFLNLYYKFRFRRGDNTLLVYLLKQVVSRLWQRNVRLHNQYGYCCLKLETQRGTMDGKMARKKYFLMNRKIYSRRFSTDCFSDYFAARAKKCKVGLREYLAYGSEKATVEELKKQNSYFIQSLYNEQEECHGH